LVLFYLFCDRKYIKNGLQISKRDYLRGKEYKSDILKSIFHNDGEQACSSHTKWLVSAVKRSFRPAVQRGAISEVKTL
jgi:hypothetical protein